MAKSVQIKKMSWWHESIFEWMIQNPDKLLRECARDHNVTQGWLSSVINSDVFKDRFGIRRDEHFANVSRDTAERISGLADLSLDVLEERIDKGRDIIGLGMVKETAEMALKALGYAGPKAGPAAVTQINIGVDANTLAESRALMQKQIETTVREVEPGE